MDELRRDLEDLAHSVEVTPAPTLADLDAQAPSRVGKSRKGAWTILGGAAAAALVIAATVVGVDNLRSDQPSPSNEAATSWEGIGVPYLSLESGKLTLHFGSGKLSLDVDDEDSGYMRLESVAATATKAFAALRSPAGETPITIVEVADGAATRSITSSATGIPLADPVGNIVAWTEAGGDTLVRVVALNTETGKQSSVQAPAHTYVVGVDGNDVYVAGQEGTRLWDTDAAAELRALPDRIPSGTLVMDVSDASKYLVLTDTGTVMYSASGEKLHNFGDDMFGTFDPLGHYAILSTLPTPDGEQTHVLFDTREGRGAVLHTPNESMPTRFRWAPDGVLIASSFDGDATDATMTNYRCDPKTAECSQLGKIPAELAEKYESSARGQLAGVPAD